MLAGVSTRLSRVSVSLSTSASTVWRRRRQKILSNGRCREAIHRTSTAPSQPNPSPDLENAEREHPEESPPGACAEAAAGGGGVVVIAT